MAGQKEGRKERKKERRKEMFYLTMHSTHFILSDVGQTYGKESLKMAREETRYLHFMGFLF